VLSLEVFETRFVADVANVAVVAIVAIVIDKKGVCEKRLYC
jgi:hypothetical protein